MKAKIISAVILAGASIISFSQSVQYVTLVSSNNVPTVLQVQPFQNITLCGYDTFDKPFVIATSTNTFGGTNGSLLYLANPAYSLSATLSTEVTGLSAISVAGYNPIYSKYSWATFKIESPCTPTVVSNYVPADAIVIPGSATGNVQIILESSPDLVNWTAASPGTYGASAGTNRFFRVRAVTN